MHIHDPRNGKDLIICMRRDEFIHLVSKGIELLKESGPRIGLPYFRNEVTGSYLNFSILDASEYSKVFDVTRELSLAPSSSNSPDMYMTSDFLGGKSWACKKCTGFGICYCKNKDGDPICTCGWIKPECKCQTGNTKIKAT